MSDVVGTHPDNRQSIASFLEQYYSPVDLRKFFDIMVVPLSTWKTS